MKVMKNDDKNYLAETGAETITLTKRK